MREFFILARDDRGDPEYVSAYDMGDFDLRTFWRGVRFDGDLPGDVRLWVGAGNPSDYLANPISWPVISERLHAILAPLIEHTCQFLPVPLYRESDRAPVRGYVLMNVTASIAAVHRDHPESLRAHPLYLDHERIPADVHIFRLEQSKTVLIVSDAFKNAIWDKKPIGVALIRTRGGGIK